MSIDLNKLDEINSMMSQAITLNLQGQKIMALSLLDDAIKIAENTNIPFAILSMRREWLLPINERDFSRVIPSMEKQIEFYRQEKNTILEIASLLQLAQLYCGLLYDFKQASLVIDELEKLLVFFTSAGRAGKVNKREEDDNISDTLENCIKEIKKLKDYIHLHN